MPWPKIRYPIYDRCGWRSCLKLKLWRIFVDVLIDNDKKVASSKKYTQLKTRMLEPGPIYNQNGQNRYPVYDQNGWKTLPFGAAHTYIAYIREYPPPGGEIHTWSKVVLRIEPFFLYKSLYFDRLWRNLSSSVHFDTDFASLGYLCFSFRRLIQIFRQASGPSSSSSAGKLMCKKPKEIWLPWRVIWTLHQNMAVKSFVLVVFLIECLVWGSSASHDEAKRIFSAVFFCA